MKSERNTTNQMLMGIILGVPISYFKSWVAFKIAHWFYLPIEISVIQWFGIGILITLFTVKFSVESDNETDSEYFEKMVKYLLYYALTLGLSYLLQMLIR